MSGKPSLPFGLGRLFGGAAKSQDEAPSSEPPMPGGDATGPEVPPAETSQVVSAEEPGDAEPGGAPTHPRPTMWRAHGASALGASHLRSGTPNQDRAEFFPEEPSAYIVACVSDGHGGAKYVRSHLGAEFAVATVFDVFREMADKGELDGLNSPAVREQLHSSALRERYQAKFGRDVTDRWLERVDAHRKAHPLQEEESRSLAEKEGEDAAAALLDENGAPRAIAYGATLLAVIVTPDAILGVQLGDGDIVFVDADGRPAVAVEKASGMLGNEAYSLCMKDPSPYFRLHIYSLERGCPEMIMLSTDGYANSFSDDESFLQVATDLHGMVRAGDWDAICENLEQWLAETSASGSGDDISTVLLVPDPPPAKPAPAAEQAPTDQA